MNRFGAAGIPQLGEAMKAFEALATDELDLKRTAQMQSQAAQFYEADRSVNVNGRQLKIELRVPKVVLSTQDMMVQEYVEGISVAQARAQDPGAVQAALEIFAEKYLQTVLGSEAFVWAEPLESNFRVEFRSNGTIRLNLVNFGSTDVLDQEAIKSTIKSLARVPLKTIFNAMNADQLDIKASFVRPQSCQKLMGSAFKMQH